jgi:hypothetical protein
MPNLLKTVPMPYEPEPDDQLKARFEAALTPHYDIAKVADGTMPFPGALRQHVFDFMDGVRVIVSVDYDEYSAGSVSIGGTEHVLHLSFGFTRKMEGNLQEVFPRRIDEILRFFFPIPPVMLSNFPTPRAFHFFFRIPDQYTR